MLRNYSYITLDFDFFQYICYNIYIMDKIYKVLDALIEKNIWEDSLIKDKDETGNNWNVHHLKLLRSLIEEYENLSK